jgi:hypothetical protein
VNPKSSLRTPASPHKRGAPSRPDTAPRWSPSGAAASLVLGRQAFLAALHRETLPTERPPLLEVLDALLGWSLARPTLLRFAANAAHPDVLSFTRAGSGVVFWNTRARRGELPQLELLPRAVRLLGEDDRSAAVRTLNAHSREALEDQAPLRIGFGALKNLGARTAVLALMDQLLVVT